MTIHRFFVVLCTSALLSGLPVPPVAQAQDTAADPAQESFDAILQRGDADQIRAALIDRRFDVPALRIETYLILNDGKREAPALPLPAAYIDMAAWGQIVGQGYSDPTARPTMPAFYLYAVTQWPLEQVAAWLEAAVKEEAASLEEGAYPYFRDYMTDLIDRQIWAGNLPEARRLYQLWFDHIGPNEPLERAMKRAETQPVYPYYDAYGAASYANYLQNDPVGGACAYFRDFREATRIELDSSSHAAPAEWRAERVKPLMTQHQDAILDSCETADLAPVQMTEILLAFADLGLLDDALLDRTLDSASKAGNRFFSTYTRARAGLAALKSNRPDIARDMLKALDMDGLGPEAENPLRAFEAEDLTLRYMIFGEHDPSAARDERVAVPYHVRRLFMACLGDMQCRADDFFVTEIGREGLQLGLQEAGDFWQLPSPISQPENGAGLAAALGPIFEAAGCDDGCSFLRAATWFASWNGGAARDGLEEAPDARYDSLDLVMPWFEAMPLPASDASASMVTDLVGEAAHDPAAARLRSLLEQKLADWQAQVAAGGVDEQLADYVARWDEYLAQ